MDAAEAAAEIAKSFSPDGLSPDELEMAAELQPNNPKPSNGECARRLLDKYEIYAEHMHGGVDYLPSVHPVFEAGMLVTPCEDSYIRDHGEPYIVLETLGPGEIDMVWGSSWGGTMRDGFMPNLRVAKWTPFGISPWWVESWAFEEYFGPIDTINADDDS